MVCRFWLVGSVSPYAACDVDHIMLVEPCHGWWYCFHCKASFYSLPLSRGLSRKMPPSGHDSLVR